MGEENWKEKYLSFCSLAEITILLLFINLLFATGKKKKKKNKKTFSHSVSSKTAVKVQSGYTQQSFLSNVCIFHSIDGLRTEASNSFPQGEAQFSCRNLLICSWSCGTPQPVSLFMIIPFTVVPYLCNCWLGYKLPSPSLTDALRTMKFREGHDWWKPDGEISNMPRGLLMIHRSQLATWLWKITINTLLQGFCSFLFHQYLRTVEFFSCFILF